MIPPTTDPPAGDVVGPIELRPATADDRPFLLAVYASTRTEELAAVPWTDDQRNAFLAMQFEAQDRWYRQFYPAGSFLVIVRGETPIGRMCVVRLATEIRLVDIALLPEHRGQGVGSSLLADLVAEADRDRLPVTLQVEPGNPARRLYLRSGFEPGEVSGFHESMTRPVGGGIPPS